MCSRLECITFSLRLCAMELILYIAFGILGGFILIGILLTVAGALVKRPSPSSAGGVDPFELIYPERAAAIRGKAWSRIHYLMFTECDITEPTRSEIKEEAIAQINSADLRNAVRSLLNTPSGEQAHELEVKGTIFALVGLEYALQKRLSTMPLWDENHPAVQEFYDYCRGRIDSNDVENP